MQRWTSTRRACSLWAQPSSTYAFRTTQATFARTYSTTTNEQPQNPEVLPPVRVIGVTLIRSGAHQRPNIRANLKALRLKKLHETVYHPNTAFIRGMLTKVSHLIKIKPVPEEPEVVLPSAGQN